MLADIAETFEGDNAWKWAVGFGTVIGIVGLIIMGIGAGIEAPDRVTVLGQVISCEQFEADIDSDLGTVATALSSDVRSARTECAKDTIRLVVLGVGGAIAGVSALWCAGWLLWGKPKPKTSIESKQ